MKKLNLFLTLGALLLATNMWAGGSSHDTHYGKFVASTTGNGKVYVSTTEGQQPADWSSETANSEATWNCEGSADNESKTGYFYAKADEEWVFEGWYTDPECTQNKSTANPLNVSKKAESTDPNSPSTETRYAKFTQDYTKSAFYKYVHNTIKNASGEATANTYLSGVTNQDAAEAALAQFRSDLLSNLTTDKNLTGLLENPGFEDYPDDWNYGWTGTSDGTADGDGSEMTSYQKFDRNGNTIARMHRQNSVLSDRTLPAADAYQTNAISLPIGYYRLSADIDVSSNDNISNSLSATLYAKSGDTEIASVNQNCRRQNEGTMVNEVVDILLSTSTSLTFGVKHNSFKNTSRKTVCFDNLKLIYVCDKATYDAYMAQYNRANNGLKDNPKLLTALNTALKEAQKDILTLAGADIANRTETLKNACDAAEAHINWVSENVKEVVNKNNMYLHLYPHANAPLSVLSRGADYGTRAIVTNSGLKLNVQTDNETLLSTVTFTDTNKKLYVTTGNAVYTDYDNSGEANFYFVNAEGGYKIVLASDHNKALYVTEDAGNKVVMLTTLDNADIWCFANEVSASVSITEAEWATYYNSQWAFIVPTGLTAVVVIKDNDNIKLVKDVYTEGETVPAGEAVLLNGEAGPYTLNFVVSSATPPYEGNNLLKGSDDALSAENMATANPGDNYFYGLSLNAQSEVSSVGFYWMNESGAAFNSGAHKAYLVLPKSSTPAPARFVFGQPGVATAVENANLSTAEGKKVMMNGVLYIIRDGKTYDSLGRMVK